MGKLFFFALDLCIAVVLCAPSHAFAATIHAADLLTLINADRAQYYLPALKTDSRLTLAAQEKADDMATKNYFAHISPEGVSPWYWFRNARYPYRFAGENLAVGFSSSDNVEKAWMGSALHRANILNAHYTQIGIATSRGMPAEQPSTFVVAEFGAPE